MYRVVGMGMGMGEDVVVVEVVEVVVENAFWRSMRDFFHHALEKVDRV